MKKCIKCELISDIVFRELCFYCFGVKASFLVVVP